MGRHLDKLTSDVKDAMRAQDKPRLQVLRMLVAGIQEEQHRTGAEELSDEQELAVLSRGIKTRRESVQQALDAGRPEIAAKENAEIAIIEPYLPRQITGDDLRAKVAEVAAEVGYAGPRDTGAFMRVWMERFKGQADGREVQAALRELG